MMHSKKAHGGWASQATRRDEQYLGCTQCGMTRHPRQQAEREEPMRPLKIAGLAIWLICFYGVVIYLLLPVLEWLR